ncbi:PD-(D/E)XK nuclease family protein [Bradyrhizobium sp. CCGE-LA001]|uniref:PD-(D/E)XK nuclease family protein n=1 Tax=Bradyrhizobium sp. CCGE-LA001 TaxID=1223566 RepID=UPI0002AAD4DF|nr:PD-(D/E)XK nuclease family protein [Bradyrhizobium sp. CCGE-LA001]AMA60143.1 hypothetical protein BCCGELA001_30530 [Bradyrhizobium sp. CCGE-LA001]
MASDHARQPPTRSGIKAPERCPHCNSTRLIKKGSRTKKLEAVAMMKCKACGRTFTPGPRALRNKTYPLTEILEAITTYNRGFSLAETSAQLSSRYGHKVSAATISRWLGQHPSLTTYSRLRSAGKRLYSPRQLIRTNKLYHRQVYEFAYHRAKLDLLRKGMLDPFIHRSSSDSFQKFADFIESIPSSCPHTLFKSEDGVRGSQLGNTFIDIASLEVIERQNAATETAALIIPGVGSNHERHSRLQRFMLANDAATIAVEVPIWLREVDIAALEAEHGIVLVPRQLRDPGHPAGGHVPRQVTGHIDFLQVRNGCLHILDYKPGARTNQPFAQLTLYALASHRRRRPQRPAWFWCSHPWVHSFKR